MILIKGVEGVISSVIVDGEEVELTQANAKEYALMLAEDMFIKTGKLYVVSIVLKDDKITFEIVPASEWGK